MTALAILGLTRSLGADVRGSITLDGEELLGLGDARVARAARAADRDGDAVAAGFAEPDAEAGKYFERTLALHGVEGAEADARIRTALADVSLDEVLLGRYPHQVSGGQAQRFAIALAVALRAEVLLADEPTSALDVTVQAQVVELLARLREEHGTAMLFISHDLAVIGRLADRVVVMRDGAVVEQGPAQQVLTAPEARLHEGPDRRGAGDRAGAAGVSESESTVLLRGRGARRPLRRPPRGQVGVLGRSRTGRSASG